jgi:hypothetical protein
MRVGLQAWGSDGDVRPVIALAAGLVRRGHSVRVVATSVDQTDYRPLCSALNVPLEMVPPRVSVDLASLSRAARGNDRKLLAALLDVALMPFVTELSSAAERLCAGSDLVVGHFMSWPLRAVAQRVGRTHVGFVPWPGMVPSTRLAPPGAPCAAVAAR